VVPVFLPVLTLLDFAPHVAKADLVMWFAILLAVNLQTSFLTPPFGLTLFYMRGAASRDIRTESIYGGIIPFVLLQVAGLALVTAFPALALYLPKLAFGE
jgi:TRAP-type mannitol/chloroaromatic compound transport system permease large subunit